MSINVGIDFDKLDDIDYIEELKRKNAITINKDDKGRYFIKLKDNFINKNGKQEDIFKRKTVKFRKGIELKNKTIILPTNAWIKFWQIEVEENGKVKIEKPDYLFINDFIKLEEGIDEVQKSWETRQQERQPKQEPQDSFTFDTTMDELPF